MKRLDTSEQQFRVSVHPQSMLHTQFRKSTVFPLVMAIFPLWPFFSLIRENLKGDDKKGIPLGFRAKMGHTADEILVSGNCPQKIIFGS